MYTRIREEIRDAIEDAIRNVIGIDKSINKSINKSIGNGMHVDEEISIDEIDEVQGSHAVAADFSSSVSFRLASKLRKSPVAIAMEIAGEITKKNANKSTADKSAQMNIIERVEAVNGYINFFLNYQEIIKPILEDAISEKQVIKKNKKIILEHTSINPSGPIHIGRLRNSLIGDSLARILKFYGYRVETHYYVNDIGKQIAIIARGFMEGIEPDMGAIERYKKYSEKEDFLVFFEYISANRRFEEDDDFKRRVQEYIKAAETGDKDALAEISGVARKCLKGQIEMLGNLDITFDSFDYESKYLKDIPGILSFLKKPSKYARTTDVGFGLDLSDFGLDRRSEISTLTRSDGTSVYLIRDVAYHLKKESMGDRMINVLGEDHKLEFRELKTILTKIYDIKTPLDVVHFSFVSFEGKGISTRKGRIAPVDELVDEAVEKAEVEIRKRKIAKENVEDTAQKIGIGAIKYHILKTSPTKQITFRWKDALNFDGESGPYIQYAHARCCSILKKIGGTEIKIETGKIDINEVDINEIDMNPDDYEKNLLFMIMKFPDIIEKCASELKPNFLCLYLYELASSFSRFYKNCPVLTADEKTRDRRILLVDATRGRINTGLNLLGIHAPERM